MRPMVSAWSLGLAVFIAGTTVVSAAPQAARAARPPSAKALGHFTHGGEKTALSHAHARWEKRYDDTMVIVVLLTEKPLSPMWPRRSRRARACRTW